MAERRVRGGALLLALVLTLGGCVTPNADIPHDATTGGQTHAALLDELEGVPGLEVEVAQGGPPNVKGNTGFEFRLALAPGYRLADAEALLDYLVEAAWSVRDGWMPNTSIEIGITGLPDDALDLVQAAVDAGWVPAGSQNSDGVVGGFSHVTVWVQTEGSRAEERGGVQNVRRLGPWPGEAPTFPDGAVVPQ